MFVSVVTTGWCWGLNLSACPVLTISRAELRPRWCSGCKEDPAAPPCSVCLWNTDHMWCTRTWLVRRGQVLLQHTHTSNCNPYLTIMSPVEFLLLSFSDLLMLFFFFTLQLAWGITPGHQDTPFCTLTIRYVLRSIVRKKNNPDLTFHHLMRMWEYVLMSLWEIVLYSSRLEQVSASRRMRGVSLRTRMMLAEICTGKTLPSHSNTIFLSIGCSSLLFDC